MKKVVKASVSYEAAHRKAEKILKESKLLLDLLESTPESFLENNDLMSLYDELIETIPALDFMIKTDGLEY